jgi:hypothetical protein
MKTNEFTDYLSEYYLLKYIVCLSMSHKPSVGKLMEQVSCVFNEILGMAILVLSDVGKQNQVPY